MYERDLIWNGRKKRKKGYGKKEWEDNDDGMEKLYKMLNIVLKKKRIFAERKNKKYRDTTMFNFQMGKEEDE